MYLLLRVSQYEMSYPMKCPGNALSFYDISYLWKLKCPVYEISYLWNVLSMKCPILWNVLSMKFPIDEMSWKCIIFPWYVLSYEMSCLWNVFIWNVPTPYIFHHFIPFSSLLLLISIIILYEEIYQKIYIYKSLDNIYISRLYIYLKVLKNIVNITINPLVTRTGEQQLFCSKSVTFII